MEAAGYLNYDEVKELIKQGAKVNYVSLKELPYVNWGEKPHTPLSMAFKSSFND